MQQSLVHVVTCKCCNMFWLQQWLRSSGSSTDISRKTSLPYRYTLTSRDLSIRLAPDTPNWWSCSTEVQKRKQEPKLEKKPFNRILVLLKPLWGDGYCIQNIVMNVWFVWGEKVPFKVKGMKVTWSCMCYSRADMSLIQVLNQFYNSQISWRCENIRHVQVSSRLK